MTTKFTPGPWIDYHEAGLGAYVTTEDGNIIAESINDANARLIAAAPEMYAALATVLFRHAVDMPPVTRDQVRAALKKARGES